MEIHSIPIIEDNKDNKDEQKHEIELYIPDEEPLAKSLIIPISKHSPSS